jgi:hypothetical protein
MCFQKSKIILVTGEFTLDNNFTIQTNINIGFTPTYFKLNQLSLTGENIPDICSITSNLTTDPLLCVFNGTSTDLVLHTKFSLQTFTDFSYYTFTMQTLAGMEEPDTTVNFALSITFI